MRAVIMEEYESSLSSMMSSRSTRPARRARPYGCERCLPHSDLSATRGQYPFVLPIVLGHEGAGVVEEVGTRGLVIASRRPRDRVVRLVVW